MFEVVCGLWQSELAFRNILGKPHFQVQVPSIFKIYTVCRTYRVEYNSFLVLLLTALIGYSKTVVQVMAVIARIEKETVVVSTCLI